MAFSWKGFTLGKRKATPVYIGDYPWSLHWRGEKRFGYEVAGSNKRKDDLVLELAHQRKRDPLSGEDPEGNREIGEERVGRPLPEPQEVKADDCVAEAEGAR